MSCPDFIPNNRPVGVGYDSRGRARSLAELTDVSVSSLSATTSITVPVIVASDGSLIIEGSVSATDGFLGTGGTGATVFQELGDVDPGYTPTPGHIIVITPAGDLSNTPASSVLTGSYVPVGGVAEDINSLTPTEDTMIYFEGTLATPQITPISDFGRSLIDDLTNTAARSTLGLGDLAVANTVQLSDIEQFPDFGGSDPISGRSSGDLLGVDSGGVLKYYPSSIFAGGGGSTTLDGLTDVTITTPASNNILRYNGSQWINSNVSTVLDQTLNGLASLSGTSGTYIYFSGPDAPALGIITDYTRDLLDESNSTGWRTKLELGTFSQRSAISLFEVGGVADYTLFTPGSITVVNGASTGITYVASNAIFSSTYQPLDSTLTTIASFNPGANQYLYFSGSNQAALGTITSQGRSLLDDSNAAENRGTIGLSGPANTLIYFSGSNAPAQTGITAAGRDLINLSPAQGDLPYYDGVNFATLPVGSEQALLRVRSGGTAPQWFEPGVDGDILTIAGGELTWSAISFGGLDTTLQNIANLTPLANQMLYWSGTDLPALINTSSYGRSLLATSSALNARNTLGLSALATRSDLGFLELTDAFDPAGSEPGAVLVVNSSVDGITWVPSSTFAGGGGSPGGSNTYVQFNDSSTFGGDSTFTFNKDTNVLTVETITATIYNNLPNTNGIQYAISNGLI